MPDDPREVLKAAGVECAEVEAWCGPWTYSEEVDVSAASEKGDDAILALTRLVAEYKWAAESLQTELLQAALDHDFSIPTLAARLAEYEAEHHG